MSKPVAPTSRLSNWWVIPTAAVGVLPVLILSKIMSFARAEAAGICMGVMFIVVVATWKHRSKRWFWPFVGIISVAEGASIWLIHWPKDHVFAKSDLNYIWLDFGLVALAFAFVEKIAVRSANEQHIR